MMRIAIATANGRIAPVFDVARQVRLIDIDGGHVRGDSFEPLPAEMPAAKVLRLAALGVNELICGAISAPVHSMIEARGIRVVGFVAGDIDQVVHARLADALGDPRYAMPGCCGRARGRGMRGRPGFGRATAQEGVNMFGENENVNLAGPSGAGQGRGGGRGQGRGGGQGQGRGGGQGQGRGGGQGQGRGGGQGQGRGGGRGMGRGQGLAAGPAGACVCPDCGFRTPHQQGVPCTDLRCPECGAAMSREQTS